MNANPLLRSRRTLPVILLLAGGLLTALSAYYFAEYNRERWEALGRSDTTRISEVFIYWIQLAYSPVIGLSMLMQGSQDVTQEEFLDALKVTSRNDTLPSDTGYGFVELFNGPERVMLSSNTSASLTLGTSMTGHAAFAGNVEQNLEAIDKVKGGSMFVDQDGERKVFFTLPTASAEKRGLMVALVNVESLLRELHILHIPPGLHCRIEMPGAPDGGLAAEEFLPRDKVIYRHVVPFHITGQEWKLVWEATSQYQGGIPFRQPLTVSLSGTLISILAALLVYLWLTHRERADELQTALRTLQETGEKLMKAEKMASLGSLVAGVAHEMNTPIGNSLTVATALREKAQQFSRSLESGALKKSQFNDFLDMLEEATGLLEHNTRRAAQLVRNFKQVAVDQSSERQRSFELRETLEEILWTLQPVIKHTPHRVDLQVAGNIHCDSFPGALGQIITNLVSNSLDHGFTDTPAGHIKIHARQQDDNVVLEYHDDGCGISAENLPHVFDPFFTTRLGQGGSGLGMNIIYNLVTGLLDGDISLASQPGGGVHIIISFPCLARQRGQVPPTSGLRRAFDGQIQ